LQQFQHLAIAAVSADAEDSGNDEPENANDADFVDPAAKSSSSSAPSAPKPKPVPASKPKSSAGGKPLSGLVCCVSGQMSTVRKQFQQLLEDAGARCVTDITGTVTHLVTTDSEVGILLLLLLLVLLFCCV
jgi:NAD-dependent DNA ligase